jgi:uncharacterized membrane protein
MLLYRALALAIAVLSAAALLYVGLYQTRAVNRLWCLGFDKGCEAVADAPFAWPLGLPDGYLGASLYLAIAILLAARLEAFWVWLAVLVLCAVAAIASVVGLRDMIRLGQFCVYCVATAVLSPVLVWAAWQAC